MHGTTTAATTITITAIPATAEPMAIRIIGLLVVKTPLITFRVRASL
jgi:hypothetical protein